MNISETSKASWVKFFKKEQLLRTKKEVIVHEKKISLERKNLFKTIIDRLSQ